MAHTGCPTPLFCFLQVVSSLRTVTMLRSSIMRSVSILSPVRIFLTLKFGVYCLMDVLKLRVHIQFHINACGPSSQYHILHCLRFLIPHLPHSRCRSVDRKSEHTQRRRGCGYRHSAHCVLCRYERVACQGRESFHVAFRGYFQEERLGSDR